MACFGRLFNRQRGSFNLPVVETVNPHFANIKLNSYYEDFSTTKKPIRGDRESGLGSLDERLYVEQTNNKKVVFHTPKPNASTSISSNGKRTAPIPTPRSIPENNTTTNNISRDVSKDRDEKPSILIESNHVNEIKLNGNSTAMIKQNHKSIEKQDQSSSKTLPFSIDQPNIVAPKTPSRNKTYMLQKSRVKDVTENEYEELIEDTGPDFTHEQQNKILKELVAESQIKKNEPIVNNAREEIVVHEFSDDNYFHSDSDEEIGLTSYSDYDEVEDIEPTKYKNLRAFGPGSSSESLASEALEVPPPPKWPPPPVPIEDRECNKDGDTKVIDELNRKTSGTLKKSRKQGVISDKSEQKESKDILIPTINKNKESETLIKDAIKANDFLNNLMDDERLNAVTDAMSAMHFPPNSYIIKEGDIGSHFFVSANGTFEVVMDSNVIKSFGNGVVFGELAILYKAKRFASIRVTTEANVWMLERKVFQNIMMKSGRKEREENVKFLSTVSVLRDLEIEKLQKVSDLLQREFYSTGSTIIQQGDPGDKFYIIRGGSVNVIKSNKEGRERLIGTLQRGAYFGEQALLHEDRRLASIISNPPGTECLTLNRIAFNEFLGGLETLREITLSESTPQEPSKDKPNSEFAHIQLHDLSYIGTLGIGGFGRVELVQYQSKQTFALKYLKKIEMVRQQQQEHAYSEKDIMLSCNSPFIVRLYKTYRDRKYLYFLMEGCLGGDVWTILQKHKYFDEKVARFMAACVIEAFEYLHSRNMIYRDLKPENLMLDDKGYIKLVDFGFAKRIGPNQKTYTFAGTPEYVSPEIILNKGHDKAVDYWALGVFIHELLVGKPPFRGKNHMKTYNAILRGIDIIELPTRIPKKAQLLIKRLCRQVAAERLGNQKNGIADIKHHPWFHNFDWQKLQNKTMPAPLIRSIKSDIDLTNFDEYPKDQEEPPDENSGWDINF